MANGRILKRRCYINIITLIYIEENCLRKSLAKKLRHRKQSKSYMIFLKDYAKMKKSYLGKYLLGHDIDDRSEKELKNSVRKLEYLDYTVIWKITSVNGFERVSSIGLTAISGIT